MTVGANLHRLTTPGVVVVISTPFMFPPHMEPFDYRRLAAHEVRRLNGNAYLGSGAVLRAEG